MWWGVFYGLKCCERDYLKRDSPFYIRVLDAEKSFDVMKTISTQVKGSTFNSFIGRRWDNGYFWSNAKKTLGTQLYNIEDRRKGCGWT